MLLESVDQERLTVMLLGESSIAVPRLESGWDSIMDCYSCESAKRRSQQRI